MVWLPADRTPTDAQSQAMTWRRGGGRAVLSAASADRLLRLRRDEDGRDLQVIGGVRFGQAMRNAAQQHDGLDGWIRGVDDAEQSRSAPGGYPAIDLSFADALNMQFRLQRDGLVAVDAWGDLDRV